MKITKFQIKKIHTLLPPQHKVDPDRKKRLIRQFTCNHALASTTNLTFDQANMLIKHLGATAVTYDNWTMYVPSKARVDVDIYRLSEWLKSFRSPVKLPITKMNKKELSKVISALESITHKKYK